MSIIFKNRIAALITCHNRREITIKCLSALFSSFSSKDISLQAILIDDGSIDGTAEFVSETYPHVTVIRGDGNLYWCGGMRVAWQAALNNDGFDYFLLLNDDTLLKPHALDHMLKLATMHYGIIVGSCYDPKTGLWTYGGRATLNGKKSLSGKPVYPDNSVQKCQQMNGNVVLIPKAVVDIIGILSDKYTHSMGDFDYGFRALDAGIPLLVAPGFQATCSKNNFPDWCNPQISLRKRIKLFNHPKGINFKEYFIFCYQHFGAMCIVYGFKVIVRLFFPNLWLTHNKS